MIKMILPATLILAFATSAIAQDAPQFSELDVNGDGVLTLDEVNMIEGFDFASADADGDGAITEAEYLTVITG